jgi:hypothetical protein
VSYAGKTRQVLDALVGMLVNVTGTQAVIKGIPESLTGAVTATASVGDRYPNDMMTEYHETEVNFYIEFDYDVENQQEDAENTVADWLDNLEEAWLQDRINTNGTLALDFVRTWSLDFSLQSDPRFRPVAGAEYRIAPVVAKVFIKR